MSAVATSTAQADLALVEAAAAQRAYVAPGQGVDFWFGKADESIGAARLAMTALQAQASDAAASARAADALSRLDDFAVIDQRVRTHARGAQRSMASDLIFADGYEVIAAARSEIAAAAALERDALTAPVARDRQIQLALLGALAACAIVALLLLLRTPKVPEPLVTSIGSPLLDMTTGAARPANHAVPDESIGAALDASLAGLDDSVLEPAALALPVAPASPAQPAVDLSSAADVCVDLARLLDARDLQAVLARIASVLGANGLIVWMADESDESLSPALTHGYAPSLIARLGGLPFSDDNATAAAWRAKNTQVVDGAIAVPLLTSAGCTGVLSVELRQGRERNHDVQSLARILAAQIAASVSPAAAEPRRAVAEG
ncbi:MAG: hypothetical protein M3Q55_17690 [Acidobacteriota bacterium]|nr:hypothetical protein [Acidobacteriota bacterium]